MRVSIRFFASLKEAIQLDRLELDLPETVVTIGDLRQYLSGYQLAWEDVFAPHKNIRAAQQLQMVSIETPIIPGAEIAFFPPVTGG
jgi:molybdopterin synthase sulfur carrier subunit